MQIKPKKKRKIKLTTSEFQATRYSAVSDPLGEVLKDICTTYSNMVLNNLKSAKYDLIRPNDPNSLFHTIEINLIPVRIKG